jgi:hypothetical protein
MAWSSIFLLYSAQEIGPAGYGAVNVIILDTLVSAAEKHDKHLPILKVVHPVTWPLVNAQLKNAVSAKPVISEVTSCRTVNPAQNSGDSASVAQRIDPFLK